LTLTILKSSSSCCCTTLTLRGVPMRSVSSTCPAIWLESSALLESARSTSFFRRRVESGPPGEG